MTPGDLTRCLAVFLWAATALAQTVILTPGTIQSVKRDRFPYAKKERFTVTSSGGAVSWSLGTKTGALAPYFTVTPTSGSTPATLTISYLGMSSETLGVGTYSATVPIIPAGAPAVNLTLTLQVRPRQAWPEFTYFQTPLCINSSPMVFPHADTCTIPNEHPPSADATPAVGQTAIDPTFGGRITRISAPGWVIQYGARTAFSASGKYLVAANASGFVNVFDVASATVRYTSVPGNINFMNWDPFDDEIYYYISGATVIRRNLRTSTSTTVANYSGAPWSFSSVSDGGTIDITGDGWWGFVSGMQACAVNLNGLSVANQAQRTYCGSMSGITPALTLVDFPQITKVDSQSKKRYVVVVAFPQSVVFAVNMTTGVLDYEYKMPEVPQFLQNNDNGDCEAGEFCIGTPHSDVFEAEDGTQHFLYRYEEIWASQQYLATLQLNKGGLMHQPLETGGGMNIIYTSSCTSFNCDEHLGCSDKLHGCVFSRPGPNGIASKLISGATSAAPAAITTSTAHGWFTGKQVLIGNAAGNTCIDGVWIITVTGASTFTLNSSNCTGAGAYTANSGAVVDGAQTPNGPNRSELVLVRPGQEVRRLAAHRSKIYNDVAGTPVNFYYSMPRASISRNGDLIAYNSNYGGVGGVSVYVVETGLRYDKMLKVSRIRPLATKAAIDYVVPVRQACTVTVSASPTLSPAVESFSDGMTSGARTSMLGASTALQADTEYYTRVTCGMYTATRNFHTLPAGSSGSTPVELRFGPTAAPGVVDMVVDYGYPETGAPSTLASSSSPVACAGGCTVTLNGIAGRVLHYRARFRNAGGADLVTHPMGKLAVQ